MPKTVTLTYGPIENAADSASGLKATKDILDISEIVDILNKGGVCVDLKPDKAHKNKVSLEYQDTVTDFVVTEILETSEDTKKLSKKVAERINEWIYTYISNQ